MTKDQKSFEDFLQYTIYNNNEELKNSVNGMIEMKAIRGNLEEGWLEMEFPVLSWEANRVGRMQGGVVAILGDVATSAYARFHIGESFAPTLELNIKYLRPIEIGDTLLVRAKEVSMGRRIMHLEFTIKSISTGKLLAVGSSMFMKDLGNR